MKIISNLVPYTTKQTARPPLPRRLQLGRLVYPSRDGKRSRARAVCVCVCVCLCLCRGFAVRYLLPPREPNSAGGFSSPSQTHCRPTCCPGGLSWSTAAHSGISTFSSRLVVRHISLEVCSTPSLTSPRGDHLVWTLSCRFVLSPLTPPWGHNTDEGTNSATEDRRDGWCGLYSH